MSEASFASLGPTLLARKGGAKPAMRPQLAPLPEEVEADQLEDLGWNDMGGEEPESSSESADIVALDPAQRSAADSENTAQNQVVKQNQAKLEEHINAKNGDAADQAKSKVAKNRSRKKPSMKAASEAASGAASGPASKSQTKKRAAFTLRLDTDRHLKLRLASTMQGVSAQALVTKALDEMLSDIDDLDGLAEQLSERLKNN